MNIRCNFTLQHVFNRLATEKFGLFFFFFCYILSSFLCLIGPIRTKIEHVAASFEHTVEPVTFYMDVKYVLSSKIKKKEKDFRLEDLAEKSFLCDKLHIKCLKYIHVSRMNKKSF